MTRTAPRRLPPSLLPRSSQADPGMQGESLTMRGSVAVGEQLGAEGDAIGFLVGQDLAGLLCRRLLEAGQQHAVARDAAGAFLDDGGLAGACGLAELGLRGLQGLLRLGAVA